MSLAKSIAGSLFVATILPQMALPAFSATVKCVPCTQRVMHTSAVHRRHASKRVITRTRIKTVYRTKFVPVAQRPVINNYYVTQQPTVRTFSAVQPRVFTQRVIAEPVVAQPTYVGVPAGVYDSGPGYGPGFGDHPILRQGAVGAALGAGTGAIIGAVTRHHRAGRGALLGAGIGALLGIGHGAMQQDSGIAGRFNPYY